MKPTLCSLNLSFVLDKKNSEVVFYLIFKSQNIDSKHHSVKRIHLLQKNVLRIKFSQSQSFHTCFLFKDSKILMPFDKTALENCIFISKTCKGLLSSVVNSWSKFSF